MEDKLKSDFLAMYSALKEYASEDERMFVDEHNMLHVSVDVLTFLDKWARNQNEGE